MALIKISGPVGNFREETKVTSARTSNLGHTQFNTEKVINFRVGNRPVEMKNLKDIEMADGDEVTVVGTNSGGGIKAVLLRNDTTEIIYGMSTWYVMAWAIGTTIAGIATLGVIIGFLLLPLGLYLLYKGYQLIQANKMMAEPAEGNHLTAPQ
jgi:hypothetical protein